MSGPVTPPLEVTEVDGSPDGRPITKLIVSNGDLTVSGRTATIDTSGSATSFPLLGTDGSAAAPTYSFASETDTGMYRIGTDELGFSTGSTNYLTMGGDALSVPNNVKLRLSDGAATTPTLSFISDTNLGIFRPSADILGFVANDAERLRFGAAGQIGIEGANYGTSGQVFSSGGSGAKPTWEDGGMASFNVAGDTGATQTITNGNTLTIKNAAGGAIKTVGVATDELTIDLTVSGVSAASYTSTDLTVDAQGRITAASSGSGGGNDYNVEMVGSELDAAGTDYNRFMVTQMLPYGNGIVSNQQLDSEERAYYLPFISPKSGDIAEVGIYLTGLDSASTNMEMGFYSDDGSGLPSSLVSRWTFNVGSGGATGANYVTSFTGSPTTVRGTQYWFGWCYASTPTTAPSIATCNYTYLPTIAPTQYIPTGSNINQVIQSASTSVNALIATFDAEDNQPDTSTEPRPIISLKW